MKKMPANLKRIIALLNANDFVNGSAIGEKLKITRSAVWKYMKQLDQYGINITSDKSRGYAMQDSLLLLDPGKIKKNLEQYTDRVQIEIFNQIESTSDYLKNKKVEILKHKIFQDGNTKDKLHICLAEHQTKGRGRFGREWISPFGKNIYFSCLWNFNKDISELAGLSLVIGLVVIKTLADLGISENVKIKWPNDIVWNSKKLAGVLIEINAETHGSSQVIMGIGLNVNMLEDGGEIDQSWTSLQQITSNPYDRNLIVAGLIKNLIPSLDQFIAFGFKSFQKDWLANDALLNKKINLEHGRSLVSGVVCGVNEQGNLLLRHGDESMGCYSSGDASIRK